MGSGFELFLTPVVSYRVVSERRHSLAKKKLALPETHTSRPCISSCSASLKVMQCLINLLCSLRGCFRFHSSGAQRFC